MSQTWLIVIDPQTIFASPRPRGALLPSPLSSTR